MKSLWTLIALWTLSGTAWAQEEPAPQEPETPQEPELEIPDIGAPSQPGMEEVLEAIEQVRQTFVAVDKAWTETRSAVDDAVVRGSESDPEGIDDKLATGLAASVICNSTLSFNSLPLPLHLTSKRIPER